MKYAYYVGIVKENGTFDWVTSIDNDSKTFHCEKRKPAVAFTKTAADNLMEGMLANMVPATVVKGPEGAYTFFN